MKYTCIRYYIGMKPPFSLCTVSLIFLSSRIGEGNGNPLQYSCLKIPWTEEPGGLQSMGSRRVGHDWASSLWLFTFMHWKRKWQPTPVFLPGESQGRGSLVGCRPWGRTESDTTEATEQQQLYRRPWCCSSRAVTLSLTSWVSILVSMPCWIWFVDCCW